MSRGRDKEERENPDIAGSHPETPGSPDEDRARDEIDRGRVGGSSDDKESGPHQRDDLQNETRDAGGRDRHVEVQIRDRSYILGSKDLETMEEIGKFRTVAARDLSRFHFGGNSTRMRNDLRRLSEQGLVRARMVRSSHGEKLKVVVLTRAGKGVLEQEMPDTPSPDTPRQSFHADLKKPAEIFHDTAIYRMYQAESQKIRSAGGRVRRVVLDYELKAKVYSPLAKARNLSPDRYRNLQDEIARENGLKVVGRKIPLPDLRIEYETRDGERAKVDLELATEDYKRSQIAEKSRAGFRIYFDGSSSGRTSVVWEEHELTAEILSL